MTDVILLTDGNFASEVLQSSELVLVDFWTPGCGPCKMLAPILEELSEDYKGKVKICKINADENSESAVEYGVMTVPTLVIFKDGKEINRLVGVAPKVNIAHALDAAL
jgi:thioredoxin 1